MAAARFVISGTVQGVSYRASARDEATRLGLGGYAKNLANGDVEVLASGDAPALDQLQQWLCRGPPMATVTSVTRTTVRDQGSSKTGTAGFVIQ